MRTNGYCLLDFGNGRKLERFGEVVLDRVSPPAEGFCKTLSATEWNRADARFVRQDGLRGVWQPRRPLPEVWSVPLGFFSLELKRTDTGHLGLFPEQAANWQWLFARTAAWLKTGRPLRVLNLFAYTGGSTLAVAAAMAAAGITSAQREKYSVAHVDSAKNVVQWARRNALISGLANAPIRWLAEDAGTFVRRERKRGRTYEAVILDPPAYGHGTRGEVWRLSEDLPRLLEDCAAILNPEMEMAFGLLTCHTAGETEKTLGDLLGHFFSGRRDTCPMELVSGNGRTLFSGLSARVFS